MCHQSPITTTYACPLWSPLELGVNRQRYYADSQSW